MTPNQIKEEQRVIQLVSDLFWTKNQIARIFGVSRTWVDRHKNDDKFPEPSFKVGRTELYHKTRIENYLDSRAEESE